jgi:peptidoglycan pentaglycine glycine transferase (the first glycine)
MMRTAERTSVYELKEIGAEWDAAWDELAGQAAVSGFMQSSAWARFKQTEGYQARRYGLFEQGELRGGGSLLWYPGDGDPGFVFCPEGPVLNWDETERAREGLRLLLRAVEDEFPAESVLGLRIEPHLPPPRPSVLRNWSRAPVDLTPIQTLMVDLTASEQEREARLHPKARYNRRIAARHGVTVRETQDIQEMAAFYALFEATARRQEFFAEPYGFFLNLGATLFPSSQASLFFADYNGEPLAAILVVFFGRRATYLYGGSSSEHRHVMPNYALHWAAMQAAQRRGCIEYDFYGYDPFGLPDHLYAGISRFKKQWGGVRCDSMGAHDCLFYDRLADHLVTHLSGKQTLMTAGERT